MNQILSFLNFIQNKNNVYSMYDYIRIILSLILFYFDIYLTISTIGDTNNIILSAMCV